MATTIEDVCRASWEATRHESSTAYDDLPDDYRAKLVERAKAVLAGEWPDGPWKDFETQVCQLADGRGSMQVTADDSEPTKPKTTKKAAKKK